MANTNDDCSIDHMKLRGLLDRVGGRFSVRATVQGIVRRKSYCCAFRVELDGRQHRGSSVVSLVYLDTKYICKI